MNRNIVKQCVHSSCKGTFYVPYYKFHMRDLCDKCIDKVNQKEEIWQITGIWPT